MVIIILTHFAKKKKDIQARCGKREGSKGTSLQA